jgi:hypothetical protein
MMRTVLWPVAAKMNDGILLLTNLRVLAASRHCFKMLAQVQQLAWKRAITRRTVPWFSSVAGAASKYSGNSGYYRQGACFVPCKWRRNKRSLSTIPGSSDLRESSLNHRDTCQRGFSSQGGDGGGGSTVEFGADPVLDMEALQESISDLAPAMARGLATDGYFTITGGSILPTSMILLLRKQCVELRRQGRFEQSWSERVVDGVVTQRFDKEGVFACEPDGQDYDIAPDLIVYMSVLLQTLSIALNESFDGSSSSSSAGLHPELSNASFNAKLAVTLPGGSTYPLHIDNPQGVAVNDTRKLTCILYLNPDYQAERGDGGELRLVVSDEEGQTQPVDLTPEGGRMVLFWSDEIPHEVLPTAPEFVGVVDESIDNPLDRYALTLWIPTQDVTTIHNESSQFRPLRDLVFPQ